MPQGLLEKIQRHMLFANLAFEIGDLATRLGQIARPGGRTARQCHRRLLQPVRSPRPVPKRLIAAIANRIAPAVKDRPLDPILASQSRPALTRLHPANDLKLESSTKSSS
jgi:hypothetical protein